MRSLVGIKFSTLLLHRFAERRCTMAASAPRAALDAGPGTVNVIEEISPCADGLHVSVGEVVHSLTLPLHYSNIESFGRLCVALESVHT